MVSDWHLVSAVSMSIGSGFRLIEPAKLYMCMRNTTHISHLGNVPYMNSYPGNVSLNKHKWTNKKIQLVMGKK